MSNKKRVFSAEFKAKVALAAIKEVSTISELATQYNITPKNIHNWKNQLLANLELAMNPAQGLTESKKVIEELELQVNKYAKKVGQLTIENEFLVGKLKSLDLSIRKTMISTKLNISVQEQCKLLNVSRSIIYYKPVSNEQKQLLKEHLIKIHDDLSCYGYLKAHKQMQEDGYSVSPNTVQKYRKELGIHAILAVKKSNLSKPNKEHVIHSYKLNNLEINKSNHVWSTDITYLKTTKGTVYLAAIIDWYSKAVLSYKVSNTMDKHLVLDVLNMALDKYGAPEIFNTDQGSQYTSEVHTQLLKNRGITISMDSKGRATDNICIERFWRSCKYERIYLNQYDNITDLKKDVADYIDFYNNKRFHQSINYAKPMEFYYNNVVTQRVA